MDIFPARIISRSNITSDATLPLRYYEDLTELTMESANDKLCTLAQFITKNMIPMNPDWEALSTECTTLLRRFSRHMGESLSSLEVEVIAAEADHLYARAQTLNPHTSLVVGIEAFSSQHEKINYIRLKRSSTQFTVHSI
ncbi:hypothetical protein BDQ17DRAFT_1333855 [Cyathus striatus]|nr:hypothetical protein BDQ17DRAFT_1333855 [Cyathus striatus]